MQHLIQAIILKYSQLSEELAKHCRIPIDKVNKTELSKLVAQKLAKKAQEKKITKIYFDRGSYKYHGRIKVFAETLRENGMEF